MTTTPPQVIDNGRYELRDTAEALKVNRSTILRWTRTGLLRASIKMCNHRKYWTGREILRFWRSYC